MLRQRHHNSVRADDAGLLARDLGDGVAEIFLMIERDVGNHRDQRLDDVGRVQPAAHADFEHRNLDADAGEVFECHHGQHLEEAGMPRQLAGAQKLLRRALDAIVNRAELDIGDGFAVHPNALVDAHQMRRAVERGLVSRNPQNRRQRRRRRAFAVGSGDQHAGKAPLGMAQRLQHRRAHRPGRTCATGVEASSCPSA